MVFIKKVNNSDAGTADLVGGNDWDALEDYFDNVATGRVAKIDSVTNFRSGRLRVTNPLDTFTTRFNNAAVAADRIITLPLLTADDTMVTANFIQTLTNKTLDSTCVINSSALASDVVREGIDNDHGDFDNSFRDNKLRLWNPADTFRMTFICPAISGNRNLNLPLTTGTDTVVSNDVAATLKSKTIYSGHDFGHPAGNIIRGTGVDNPYAGHNTGATLNRTGLFTANTDTEASGYVGSTWTAVGTGGNFRSTTEGFGRAFATGAVANNNAGLRQGTNRFRREWTAYAIGRVQLVSTSDVRLFIGFSSDTAEIAGETTLNNFSGCGIGKRTGDTNLFTMRNDGDATEDRVDTTIAASTNFFTFEMQLDATNFQCKIDGVSQTAQTTELPASATDLGFHCEIETGAGAADKTINIMPIFFRCGT